MNGTLIITDEEVASLAQSILTRYGIDFTCYEPISLKRRITRLLSIYNFASIQELWIRILRERAFIYTFMNEISVGMTSMFRDPIFWKHLKLHLCKNFATSSQLSIWHAGCSTGEEVYSLGILLSEIEMLSKSVALATDINQDAIEVAKRGVYHKIRMIENERDFKEYNTFGDFSKYYSAVSDGRHVQMNEKLIHHVKFGYQNLISDSVTGKFDLILCRNVMIYFDLQAKKNLLQKFYNALNPGGYFVIGFYDTMLPMIDQKLFTLVDDEAKIFRKAD